MLQLGMLRGMLRELPFYDELSIVKTSKAFKGYVVALKVVTLKS